MVPSRTRVRPGLTLDVPPPSEDNVLLLQEDVLHGLGRSRKGRTSLKLLPVWSHDTTFTLLGRGRTSHIWRAPISAARQLFRSKDWWTTESDIAGPDVALKDIDVKKELVQVLSSEDRTIENVKERLRSWKARCRSIYKPLSRLSEAWGIAPYVVRPHACAFMRPTDDSGRARRKHLPHLVVASDVARGRGLRAHFAHLRATADSASRTRQDALSILAQCLSVLSALAAHGIYHNDLHGGNVLVDGDAGEGTSFRLCFPRKAWASSPTPRARSETAVVAVDVRGLAHPACVARVLDFDLASRRAPANANFSPSRRAGHPPFRDAFQLYAHIHSAMAPHHLPGAVDKALRSMVVDAAVDPRESLAWLQPIQTGMMQMWTVWRAAIRSTVEALQGAEIDGE